METVFEFTFWLSIFLIFYSYAGYPLLLALLTSWKTVKKPAPHAGLPNVTLVIAAHNEETHLARKLDNSLNLDYPQEKLEIMVASDGSTDATTKIARKYEDAGVKLLHEAERSGKTSIQNSAVEQAGGEVVVFSDANAIYDLSALRNLVQHFSDPAVGCVCGELKYTAVEGVIASEQEDLYWDYEKFLKRKENMFGTILGANGSIYAVRKSAYKPLPNALISDFIEPMLIAESGYKVIYEPTAISYEHGSSSFSDEFKRKRRIILRSLNSLFTAKSLLNPFKQPRLAFQLFSHKILRWGIPILLMVIFLSNLALLGNTFSRFLFWTQAAFYLMAS